MAATLVGMAALLMLFVGSAIAVTAMFASKPAVRVTAAHVPVLRAPRPVARASRPKTAQNLAAATSPALSPKPRTIRKHHKRKAPAPKKPAPRVASANETRTASRLKVAASARRAASNFVVVIDPGHQGQGNNTPEPIGPGSSQTKPAVADGTGGVVTHVRESVVNLAVSLKVREMLRAHGITVVMVRTSENVNIPNSKRAAIANREHAGLFLRLHCDGENDHSVNGLLTVVPARNQWFRA